MTAKNIWKTIHNPVTYEMITGQTDIMDLQEITPESETTDYYVMDYVKHPDGCTTLEDNLCPLRELHNFIKNRLITDILSLDWNRPLSIMDTSIGRGGDIHKYLSSST